MFAGFNKLNNIQLNGGGGGRETECSGGGGRRNNFFQSPSEGDFNLESDGSRRFTIFKQH
jgi:hypothetical protein